MKTKETQLDALREIFPVVEIYEQYFSKLKSTFKPYVELKKVAVKDLLALNFFNRQLTQKEVGLVIGCTRWNVAILEKSEVTEDHKKMFKKCIKKGLYPVATKTPEDKKKYGEYKLVERNEI